MTTTAQQCIAYRHERSCHDLIILSLPARLYVSQGGNCCVKPIAVLVLHRTVDSCTLHVDDTHRYNDRRLAQAVRK